MTKTRHGFEYIDMSSHDFDFRIGIKFDEAWGREAFYVARTEKIDNHPFQPTHIEEVYKLITRPRSNCSQEREFVKSKDGRILATRVAYIELEHIRRIIEIDSNEMLGYYDSESKRIYPSSKK